MKHLRRRFFLASALAALITRLLPAHAASRTVAPDTTLRAYVDTLVPADETPSGSALGVDAKLKAVAADQPERWNAVSIFR